MSKAKQRVQSSIIAALHSHQEEKRNRAELRKEFIDMCGLDPDTSIEDVDRMMREQDFLEPWGSNF